VLIDPDGLGRLMFPDLNRRVDIALSFILSFLLSLKNLNRAIPVRDTDKGRCMILKNVNDLHSSCGYK
jgi:hypothetical protein